MIKHCFLTGTVRASHRRLRVSVEIGDDMSGVNTKCNRGTPKISS
jgi:TolB-like protein